MVPFTLSDISKYLTLDVIEEAFKKKTGSKESVQSLEITRAAAAGEGLLSAVYRLKVSSNNHKASFVVKGLVRDSLLRRSLGAETYFERECVFYGNILPTLKQIQESSGAKERIQNNVPICYSCYSDGNNDYIVIEDLCENFYEPISSTPTLSERDAILKTLAHFHATSMALRIRKPNEFQQLARSLPEIYFTDTNRNWYARYLQNAIDIDIEALMEFEKPSSKYYNKFLKIINDDVYKQVENLITTSGDHLVLNHGDAWCSNFMRSGDKGIAIDFQIVRCTSPAADLSYFLLMCNHLFNQKEDFIVAVKIYYDSLVYYLEDMDIRAAEVFSWEDLNSELKKYGKIGLLASLTSIPLLAGDRLDTLQSFEEKYKNFYKIPLDILWPLSPFKTREQKLHLVNAIRIAVDLDFI